MQPLMILADENMLNVETLFSNYGKIKRFNGRNLRREDLDQVDVLLIRSITKVDQNLLENCSLKFIGSATIGTDHVNLDYLNSHQISFAHAPGCNAGSVVQYVFAALAQSGRLTELLCGNQKLGIIGAGNVGGLLFKVCHQLGISICIYDPFRAMVEPEWTSWSTLDEVLNCDVLSLHVPLTHDGAYPTYHLLDGQKLAQISKDSFIINSSRGAVIDSKSLFNLMQHKSWQVALDVWENEPNIDYDLCQSVTLATSHIAGYSVEGKTKGTEMIYEKFVQFFKIGETDKIKPMESKWSDLTWNVSLNLAQNLAHLILSTYPIEKDSLQLKSLHQSQLAQGFDQLRKNYWQRSEFNQYRVCGVKDAHHIRCLKALGFQVKLI